MKNVIKIIKKNKVPCYFISPHLDDAALSSGELMRYLSKITKVIVINVFTNIDSKQETRMVKNTLKFVNCKTSKELYKKRKDEDYKALKSINVRSVNLNFVEAPWRKISNPSIFRQLLSVLLPEFIHLYPTYSIHISKGRISRHDDILTNKINLKLRTIIPENAIVFCPLGIGDHVDHLITKSAVEKTFSPIFWVDQPYFNQNKLRISNSYVFKGSTKLKIKLVSFYKTQIKSLFPKNKISSIYERFVINKSAVIKYSI